MPELPDVETFRRYLDATALHHRIEFVQVKKPSILHDTSPQGLGRALKHRSFCSSTRHGKYLFAALDNDRHLVMHFGMTGKLSYFGNKHDVPDHTLLLLTFENGSQLAYVAPRSLGLIALTDTPGDWRKARDLGPDAFNLTEEEFLEQAHHRRGGVKSWLMNQQSIAGIGNVYSDEILYQAGIHPRRSVHDLDERNLRNLFSTMCSVLQTAIDAKADPQQMPSSFLLPHRKQDGRCPACNSPLQTTKAAGRTAWYCPRCQQE